MQLYNLDIDRVFRWYLLAQEYPHEFTHQDAIDFLFPQFSLASINYHIQEMVGLGKIIPLSNREQRTYRIRT